MALPLPPKEFELPPNAAPDKVREHKRQMIEWVSYRLRLEHAAADKRANSQENFDRDFRRLFGDGSPLDAARHGDGRVRGHDAPPEPAHAGQRDPGRALGLPVRQEALVLRIRRVFVVGAYS